MNGPAHIPEALATALSHSYRLLAELGAGGMARVYLAEDLKHHRKVAVKVLRPELAASLGSERFLREIEIAAGLQHPHILPLFDSGAISGDERPATSDQRLLYFVMPFVEGESLRSRLDREKQLPVDDALRITREVADALGYAHAHGVVHRDIKPENILLASGHALVADFGIARAVAESGNERLTGTGLALGTPSYMSPEQAAGEHDVDHRSDLYSLGCMLYEMLAGQPPFHGATLEALLRQHLTAAALPVTQFRPSVPASVVHALAIALAKAPADRYATAGEFAAALTLRHDDAAPTLSTAHPAHSPAVTSPAWRRGALLAFGAAVLIPAIWWATRTRVSPLTSADAALSATPRLVQLSFQEGVEEWPAWSPDGTKLAFVAELGGFRKVFVKDLAAGTERQLTSEPRDDIQPAWSPDGKYIAFVRSNLPSGKLEPGDLQGTYARGGDIWLVELATGRERHIIEEAFAPSWAPDGKRLAFEANWAGGGRIWLADSGGRNPAQATTDSSEAVDHATPRWSPDGARLVYRRVEKIRSDIMVTDIASKATHAITNDNIPDLDPVWSPSGAFIYFSTSRGGGYNIWRVPVRPDGSAGTPAQQLTTGAGPDIELAMAPDGRRLAFTVLGINPDVWRLPVDPQTGRPTGAPSAVVTTTRVESRATWSPDGQTIAFNSDRLGDMNLWTRSLADGTERQVTTGPGGDYQPDWSPDGNALVFFSSRSGNNEIWSVTLSDSSLTQLTSGPGTKTNPFYSPDGRHIAFHSDRDGRIEAWVMRADGSDARQLTTNGSGGHFMRWSEDGKSLIASARTAVGVQMVRIDIATGQMQPLPPIASGAHISLSPDHRRILDVRNHKTLWVHPLDGGAPYQVFEFTDPDVRIDYPVWSPDGRSVLFERSAPRGGDIWLQEGIE